MIQGTEEELIKAHAGAGGASLRDALLRTTPHAIEGTIAASVERGSVVVRHATSWTDFRCAVLCVFADAPFVPYAARCPLWYGCRPSSGQC